MPRFDLVLLDLDGTLTDPLEGIASSINHALRVVGHPELSLANVAAYIGPPIDVAFQSIMDSNDEAAIRQLVEEYRKHYGAVGYSQNEMYPHIAEVLEHLVSHGQRIAVCTSKRQDFALKILALFEIDHLFDFVCGGDIGVAKTQQIASLCRRGIASDASVMIGDRAVDVVAARANGLMSAGVLWGYGSRTEIEAERPDFMLSDPQELVQLASSI